LKLFTVNNLFRSSVAPSKTKDLNNKKQHDMSTTELPEDEKAPKRIREAGQKENHPMATTS
jgi:hypothetical protein